MIGIHGLAYAFAIHFIFWLIWKNQDQITFIPENAGEFFERINRVFEIFDQVACIYIIIGVIWNGNISIDHIAGNIYFIFSGECIGLGEVNAIAIYFLYLITSKANVTALAIAIGKDPFSYFSCFRRMLKTHTEPSS